MLLAFSSYERGMLTFVVIVGIIISVIVSCLFGEIAKMKGHSYAKYFVICLFLGLAGWIMVSALPDRSKNE